MNINPGGMMSPKRGNDNLTSRQQELLDLLRETAERGGTSPSYREIGVALGIRSTNGVKVLVDALVRKGFLRPSEGRARGLELTASGRLSPAAGEGVAWVPLIGRVAAGAPILAEQNVEEMLPVDRSLLRGAESFALEVRGDSMVEAGILDGDIVFAEATAVARAGEMVVARVGEEATVKFFFPEAGQIRLQPANEHYAPILVDPSRDEFHIEGRVTGLLRRYR
jgi:repressor LexA